MANGSLQIDYEDGEGHRSERVLSDVVLTDAAHIAGHCHLRNAERSFAIARIHQAVDLETGEVIADLRRWLGAEAPLEPVRIAPDPPPSTWLPGAPVLPQAPSTRERYRGQRSREKSAFQRPYQLAAIFDLYRRRFFAAFGDVCFKCGTVGPLVMDHHIPLILGGHTEAGNLVALCSRCNGRKRDRRPEEFYSLSELKRLAPLLAAQAALFAFRFDWRRWSQNRRSYLLDIGLDSETVDRIFTDPDHPDHRAEFPDGDDVISATIVIDKDPST